MSRVLNPTKTRVINQENQTINDSIYPFSLGLITVIDTTSLPSREHFFTKMFVLRVTKIAVTRRTLIDHIPNHIDKCTLE